MKCKNAGQFVGITLGRTYEVVDYALSPLFVKVIDDFGDETPCPRWMFESLSQAENRMNIYVDEIQAKILIRLINGEGINSAEKREIIDVLTQLEEQEK